MVDFHALLFAGGVGQRLWPLSRTSTPKQFAALLRGKSSIQLAVERLARIIPHERMFVGTNRAYAETLKQQLPSLPERNFILEPARRDVAAAVALAFFTLEKDGIGGPVVFQWADHHVEKTDALLQLLDAAGQLLERDPQQIVIIAEEPRSANDNLGWIELEESRTSIAGIAAHTYRKWHYRPPRALCEEMLAAGNYAWNTGHFVSSVEFMTATFRAVAPELARAVEEIVSHRGKSSEASALAELFPKLPALHFDQAFLERVPRDRALVIKGDLGWHDPGNLYSLKEFLAAVGQQDQDATVSSGPAAAQVVHLHTSDSLIHNASEHPVMVMGLSGVIVVELADATLVVHKDSVRDMGALLAELKARGFGHLL